MFAQRPLPPEPLPRPRAQPPLTALPASAFVPEPRAQPSERDAVFAGAAVIAAELLLAASTMQGQLPRAGRAAAARARAPLVRELSCRAILLGALVDRLVLRGFVRRRSPSRCSRCAPSLR